MIRRAVALAGLVAAVALTGCASDSLEEHNRELQSEILDLASERDTERERLANAMADLEAERALRAQHERELNSAVANEQAAIRRAQELDDEIKRLQSAPPPQETSNTTVQQQVEEFNERGIPAFMTPDGDVGIRLASDVTFGSGKAALTKSGMSTLRKLGPDLTSGEFAQFHVRVEGHTDNEPLKKTKHIYGDNRGLGSARANSVTQFLERELGISPSRIEAVSKGEHEPIADNGTKAGRAQNRRVEIILVMPRENIIDQPAAK
jgi:flagellar motor protein MotB